MELYMDTDSPQSQKVAKEIDTRYPGNTTTIDYTTSRRYGSGQRKDKFNKHRIWLAQIRQKYLKEAQVIMQNNPSNPVLDLPMRHCLNYSGLAEIVGKRALDDAYHGDSVSVLYGLFSAIVDNLFQNEFSVEPFIIQVFRTVDAEDIGIAKIVTTMLTTNHCSEGGLNIAVASANKGGHGSSSPDWFNRVLTDNARSIRESGVQKETIEASGVWIQRFIRGWKMAKYIEDPTVGIDKDLLPYTPKNALAAVSETRERIDKTVARYRAMLMHAMADRVYMSLPAVRTDGGPFF